MQARMQASPNPSILPQAAGTVPVKRSTFVSIIAWLLIVLSAFGMLGLSTAAALMQQWLTHEESASLVLKTMLDTIFAKHVPPFLVFLLAHAPAICAAMAGAFALQLLFGIALLLRKNWARLVIMELMLFDMLMTLLAFWLVHITILASVKLALKSMTGEQLRISQLTYDDLWVNHLSSALVFLIPFGVVIFTLLSAKVKPEFA